MEEPLQKEKTITEIAVEHVQAAWLGFSHQGQKVFESIYFDESRYVVFNVDIKTGLYTFEVDLINIEKHYKKFSDIYIMVNDEVRKKMEGLGFLQRHY